MTTIYLRQEDIREAIFDLIRKRMDRMPTGVAIVIPAIGDTSGDFVQAEAHVDMDAPTIAEMSADPVKRFRDDLASPVGGNGKRFVLK